MRRRVGGGVPLRLQHTTRLLLLPLRRSRWGKASSVLSAFPAKCPICSLNCAVVSQPQPLPLGWMVSRSPSQSLPSSKHQTPPPYRTHLHMCWMASWSPSQSEPLMVSYACQRQSSTVMLPSAALMPPCAATVWERVGNSLVMHLRTQKGSQEDRRRVGEPTQHTPQLPQQTRPGTTTQTAALQLQLQPQHSRCLEAQLRETHGCSEAGTCRKHGATLVGRMTGGDRYCFRPGPRQPDSDHAPPAPTTTASYSWSMTV